MSKTKAPAKSKSKTGLDPRLVKAIGHPLRLRLLTILNERVASPSELADELGETLGNVSYHVRKLADLKCIELVKTTPVRGALEHHYRAVARPVFSDSDWARLPDSIRKSLSDAVLAEIAVDMGGAAEEGGFNRDEMHVSRTPITLDQEGWKELNELLQNLVFQALEIQAQSAERLQQAGTEDSEAAELVLMLFEPPSGAGKSGRRKAPAGRRS
jgi:DNA-binding transcriptional ArsR family regulator